MAEWGAGEKRTLGIRQLSFSILALKLSYFFLFIIFSILIEIQVSEKSMTRTKEYRKMQDKKGKERN